MLVFRVLTFSSHNHNNNNAENRGDGCASPILQQDTFSFKITNNMYLLTISELPTGCCSPPTPILSTTRRAPPWYINTTTSSLENERICSFSRVVTLCHHHHPYPPKTSIRACFRGKLFFATTTTLLPRKQAYVLVFEPGCSLPPPAFSLKNKRTHLFSRTVVLCHHLAPPLSSVENEHTRSFSRLVALCYHHHHP